MIEHQYSHDFYDYIDAGSRRSARAVAALLLPEITIAQPARRRRRPWRLGGRMAGRGGEGRDRGRWRLCAAATSSAIPADNFRAHDLATPLDLKRRFDLVQTLEVAEHLPHAKADLFVDNLIAPRRRHPVFRRGAAPGRRASRQRAAARILAREVRRKGLCAVRFRPPRAGRQARGDAVVPLQQLHLRQ